MARPVIVLAVALVCGAFALRAVTQQPYKLTEEETSQVRMKLELLAKDLAALKQLPMGDDLVADVEIYHKAAEWILRHPEEFYAKTYMANTLTALDRGRARAQELRGGKPSWVNQKGRLVRAYRSRVDGSVQPYGLIIPDAYDPKKPMRLDVVLHGRGATLNEVSFIAAHDTTSPVPPDQDFIRLEVFGRTNNAYRWAGETDVFEALASVEQRYNVDRDRVVLRGFSMGGAGAWHIGLHYPDRWAAVEAGAGFTETRRFAKLDALPPYQEATLRIYDAVDYALNVVNVPTVGYGGEDDAQLQASANMREQLIKEGFRFTPDGLNWRTTDLRAVFLVGPKTGHKFHPDSQRESNRFISEAVARGRRTPDHVRFVTWTPRYNQCFGITVDELERQYQRAEVDAQWSNGRKTLAVHTKNVARLLLPDPTQGQDITIDGQPFTFAAHRHVMAATLLFERKKDAWTGRDVAVVTVAGDPTLRKKHGLQGPIDDAFTDAFLCVRPTGTPNHARVNAYAKTTLDRFAAEYDKWLRADARIKDDNAVTKDDIANYHLILFGDPASNRILGQIAERLPIRWTKEGLVVGKQTFSAADHVPVFIYPNPLNPRRYIVINSGHTFHEPDFRGTNARLFPRLGDYAVLRLADPPVPAETGSVVVAGLFGEHWELSGDK